uniref:Uncharacterized protein n=1 Tax=Cucumis melo TaxID=3656 RepID=A0A9I9E2F7_CUCME
ESDSEARTVCIGLAKKNKIVGSGLDLEEKSRTDKGRSQSNGNDQFPEARQE